jgi:DNA invertase Pin-like site-specific DNA recombinase
VLALDNVVANEGEVTVAYCRTACPNKSDPLAGVKLQEKEIRRYAKRHGAVISTIYADAGVSGATLERPELQRLIADCRAGKIGTVVTKDLDRLSRDMRQQIALLCIFATAGVRVEFSAREGHSDTFLIKTLSAVAELGEAATRSK